MGGETLIPDSTMHKILKQVVLSWRGFTTIDEKQPYIALLRNHCSLLRQILGQETAFIRNFMMEAIQAHPNIVDLWDLHVILEEVRTTS